jgi:hypothetical protein
MAESDMGSLRDRMAMAAVQGLASQVAGPVSSAQALGYANTADVLADAIVAVSTVAPGAPGVPTHPIYLPGQPPYPSTGPGFPTHPMAPGGPPPGIWPSPGVPTHPIAPGGPPPGIWPSPGLPTHPIMMPMGRPHWGQFLAAWMHCCLAEDAPGRRVSGGVAISGWGGHAHFTG